jgi:hypothetical protein
MGLPGLGFDPPSLDITVGAPPLALGLYPKKGGVAMHGDIINVEVKHPREWPTPVERVKFFQEYLERLGYATGTSRAYANCVKHFEKWLATDACSGEVPCDGTVRRFEREHLDPCGCCRNYQILRL